MAYDLINEKELLALVKAVINFDFKDAYARQIITGCKLLPDQGLPWWAADPKFAHIVRSIYNITESAAKKDIRISIRESLKQASSISQIQHIVEEVLVEKIASVSMILEEDVDLDKSLAAYGMDSLVAVEIRNWIINEMAANIPALEFIASSSLGGLIKVIMNKFTLVDLGAVSASATK